MADVISEVSCLSGLLGAGVPVSADDAAELSIEERSNMVQLQLIARQDQATELADAVAKFLGRKARLAPLHGGERGDLIVCATAPREYWLLADQRTSSGAIAKLLDHVGDFASQFDQTSGRFVIRLTGRNAIHVLAKGTALDLHESVFPAPGACHTQIEHMPALILRGPTGDCFDVSVPRSYAASFIAWLQGASREYGAIVEAK